jgi:hypothetical protein
MTMEWSLEEVLKLLGSTAIRDPKMLIRIPW